MRSRQWIAGSLWTAASFSKRRFSSSLDRGALDFQNAGSLSSSSPEAGRGALELLDFVGRALDGLLDRGILLKAEALKLVPEAGRGALELLDFVGRALDRLLDRRILLKPEALELVPEAGRGALELDDFVGRALDCLLHGGVFLVPLGLELLAENQRGLSEVANLGLGLKKLVRLIETFL